MNHLMSLPRVILLLSYICMASISAAMITPALPEIERDFFLSHGTLEWVISIFLLGYVLGQLIYGPIANRFGRLNALRAGLIINLIGILICMLSTALVSIELLLVGRFVSALGAAAGLSCTFILIRELLLPQQAKVVMSYAIMSFTLGVGIAVLLGGWLTQYAVWQYCFPVLLIHGIIMLALTWQFKETLANKVSIHPSVILKGYLRVLTKPEFVAFSFVLGYVATISYCYAAAAPLYSQKYLGLTPSGYGYWNLLNMLGMVGSSFLSVFMLKRFSYSRSIIIGLGLLLPGVLSLIALSQTQHVALWWFFGTTTSLYLFSGMLFPAASHYAMEAVEDKASGASMMSFINMGSSTVAVIILGYLPFDSVQSLAAIISIYFMAVASIVLYFARKLKHVDAQHAAN